MKKFRLICMALAALLTVSTFAACGQGGDSEENGKEPGTVISTDYDLVKNKTSEYKIVLESDALYNERLARDEIVDFFYQATGITLQSVTDDEATYGKDSKLIILGDTEFTEQSGVNAAEIPFQGYTIKTVDSNLFIVGDDYGVLYGAYEFLSKTLNYEIFASDEIRLMKNVTDLKLPDLNISDSPDILWREPNYGPLEDVTTGNRFRVNNNIWITESGNFIHNSFDEYFPKKTYESTHPEFYSDGGKQLCYCAHGNPESYALMQDIVFERIKTLVNKFYSQGDFRGAISFTQEDNNTWCNCPSCSEQKDKYGTDAAVVIQFLNPVAKKVQEWLDETWSGHSLDIAFFAYYTTEKAPVTASGETLEVEDNVAVFYAPIQGQYMWDFNHEKNASYMQTMKNWRAVCDKFYLWFYSTNYRDYLVWYDSFNSMQSMYRLAKEYNANYLFDQGRYNATSLTAFDSLKVYLNCKLAWNVDADVVSLTNDFFDNYFGAASGAMKKYYNSFRSWSQNVKDNLGISGQCLTNISSATYWPKRILEQWEDCIEEAYQAIEPLKNTDSATYEKLYDRIMSEGIAIRYHLYESNANDYDATELKALRLKFKEDATRLGFTKLTESGSIEDNVYKKWGI